MHSIFSASFLDILSSGVHYSFRTFQITQVTVYKNHDHITLIILILPYRYNYLLQGNSLPSAILELTSYQGVRKREILYKMIVIDTKVYLGSWLLGQKPIVFRSLLGVNVSRFMILP